MSFLSRRNVVSSLIAGGVTLALVSCGSRTGLFGPDPSDLITAQDAGKDAADVVPDGPIPCIPGRFTFELALTQLMFVIDRSGSMAFDLEGHADNPPVTSIPEQDKRWRILQGALQATITTFDQQIAMGAKFFPEVLTPSDLIDSEKSCRTDTGVGIPPARGNAQKIISTFDTSQPRGGTPTSEAVRIAAQFLTASRSIARTIVLATDGAPNCNGDLDADTCVCTSLVSCASSPDRGRYSCLDDSRTIDTIRVIANDQKIPVYVIGIGGTEKPEFLKVLDDMAIAGGRPKPTTPRHYNVQSSQDLKDALVSIRDSVAKCTYLTPSAPTDPNAIRVEIDGVSIPRDQTKTNGWDWIDQAFGELAFFGDACLKAQGSGLPSVVSGVVTCDTRDR